MLLNEMSSPQQKFNRIVRFLNEAYGYKINTKNLTRQKVTAMMESTTKKINNLKENNGSQTEMDRLMLVLEGLKLWTETPYQTELTKPIREGLDDSDVDSAKVILAAQEISDRLQKMVEDLAQMQVQDLMPIVDAMKSDIGTAEADAFNSSVDAALGTLLDSAKSAKDDVSNAILAAQGQAPTDMDMGMDDMGMDDMGDDMGMDDMGDDMGMDDEFGGDAVASGPEENPLGRGMKGESMEIFDQMLEDIQSNAVNGMVKQSDLKAAFAKYRR